MHTHILASKQRLAIMILVLLVLLPWLSACNGGGFGSDQAKEQFSQTELLGASKMQTIGLPSRLLIQTAMVHVDAPIEAVGIDASGNLATPTQSQWDGTGWYRRGPRPGEQGSAVLDGHLDRPGGSPAVFWDLKKLNPGDQVTVVDDQGVARHFQVNRVERYTPDTAPLQDIFDQTTGHYLNLITCAGVWIPAQHQTTERLVVYTSLIG